MWSHLEEQCLHLGTSGETFGTAWSHSHSRFSPLLSLMVRFLAVALACSFLLLFFFVPFTLFLRQFRFFPTKSCSCLNYLFSSLLFLLVSVSPSVPFPCFPLVFPPLQNTVYRFLRTLLANPVHSHSETFLEIVNKCLQHCADMSWCRYYSCDKAQAATQ